MSSGPLESKRPRLSEPSSSSWSSGTPHGGVSLPHPTPPGPPPSGPSLPPSSQHPAPGQYQPHYPPPISESHAPPPPPSAPQPPPLRPPPPQQHPEGRRHHDQEPYGTMQDYRTPPSPAHAHAPPGPPGPPGPFHGSFPVRDPAIKRDPAADDPMSQPRRPHSNGNVPDGLANPPPPIGVSGPPQPPPHQVYHDDGRRHMSFDAGPPSMPPTPGGYRQPNYPPPTPIAHHQPYEPMGFPPSEPFYNVYSSTAKRKATRASQACDSCRSLKAKCDETKPCKNCREKNMECKYRDPIPKAGDKAQADILDGVQSIQKTLHQFMQKQNERMGRIESVINLLHPQLNLKHEDVTMEQDVKSVQAGAQSPLATSHDEPYQASPMTYDMPDEELEAEPGPPVAPGEPSIPVNHTTGAGHLLGWPCIHEMVKEYLTKERIEFVSEYPIRQEEARGLLRVYGRGEGRDAGSPDRDGYGDHGVLEGLDDSSYSDISTPSPAGESYWGHVGGFSPVNPVEYTTSNPKPPVLNPAGIPDFSQDKINTYLRSFEENILNMHPIINLKDLRAMVRMFQESIPKPPTKPMNPATTAIFVHSTAPPVAVNEVVGSKRKRSPGAEVQEPTTPIQQQRAGRPTRTINNAVVLTMLALGKICLYRDGIPDVVHEPDPHAHSSPVVKNGHPASPGYSHTSPPESFGANSLSSGIPSPREHEKSLPGRRPSLGGTSTGKVGQRRNYDNIPGLEYFAIASDVIGNQMGGNTMNHVYANIFAGLFHGQLGRVIESHAYIAHACTVLMNILRPSLNRLREMKESNHYPQKPRDNQLVFAFWTCLQLESDIVAEIPRHQSGILAQEENMPYPNMELWQSEQRGREGGLEDRVIESYMAQLYLRKHLNMIHRMFYSVDSTMLQGREAFARVSDAQDRVAGMQWCSPNFKFSEADKPAEDILAARLRAKYWGAQVITYRPFIKQILDFSHSLHSNQGGPTPFISEFRNDIGAPRIHPNARGMGDVPDDIIEHARMGIRALVESTKAFHGLAGGRPIITNVFGTAHAQWGNLLVLAACFRNPILRKHIDEEQLKELFYRTIQFFKKIAMPTSALAKDRKILEGLRKDLFDTSHLLPNTSFSSATSTPMQAQPMMAGAVHDSEPMSATTPNSGEAILPHPGSNQPIMM